MEKMIRKAVFPVAGLGTRFLPATKANPKEMLPIVDKPLIQYAVEEAVAAGIKELIFVTSYSKRAIEDHFDRNHELESKLEERGRYKMLALVRNIIPDDVTCVYVRQSIPLGLGHAVLCAKEIVGNEPFAVMLADDLIDENSPGCLGNMLSIFEKTENSVVAVLPILPAETEKYGVIGLTDKNKAPYQITQIIEKPKSEDAPSNLGVVGRYILTPDIFKHLEKIEFGAGNELQLTDAISSLLNDEAVYAYKLKGIRYDCGNKFGYVRATLNYALKDEEIGKLVEKLLIEKGKCYE